MGTYLKNNNISNIPIIAADYGSDYEKFKWNLQRMSNFNKFYNNDEDSYNLMKMLTSERIITNVKKPLSIIRRMKLIKSYDNYYVKNRS